MSGKKSRTKGHQFERDIANDFKEMGWDSARRQLEYQEGLGVDLENTYPFQVQCKRYKDYCPISKIEEVNPDKGEIPMLITKGDRKKAVCVMYWEDVQEMIERLRYYKIY